MSIRIISRVWDHFTGKGSDLLVMLALADWADDEGRCFPSVAALAAKVRLEKRQAQRVVNGLIKQGFITVTGNERGGAPGMTRRYKINIERLTDVIHDIRTGVIHDTPLTGDGCHPRRETGVTGDTQTVIEPSVDISASSRKRAKKNPPAKKLTLADWLEKVKAAGEKAVANDTELHDYCCKAGIPYNYLVLAWTEFKARYLKQSDKTYVDWQATFRNAVRGNWLKLWFIKGGHYRLTVAGQQALHHLESAQ